MSGLDALIEDRGGAAAVLDKALRRYRGLDAIRAADLPEIDEEFDDELIEGILGRSSTAVLYGDSNSGKTFLAIDMAASVDAGREWMGRPTVPGAVVYLATEAAKSVETRVRLWQSHHGIALESLYVVRSPVNFFDSAADVSAVVDLVRRAEEETGRQVVLIVADTLARISAGANENSGEDMGIVMANADAIRAATSATFLWIHHCGKDAARGARGWSGIRAHIDTEIEVTADEATGIRTAEVTKQRDLPSKGQRIGFRLLPIAIGRNRWGTERSSCVLQSADAPPPRAKGKRQSEIAGAITEFLTAHGRGCLRAALAKHFDGRYLRASVYREVNKMLDDGLLIHVGNIVALPGAPESPTVSNCGQETVGDSREGLSPTVSSPFRGGDKETTGRGGRK